MRSLLHPPRISFESGYYRCCCCCRSMLLSFPSESVFWCEHTNGGRLLVKLTNLWCYTLSHLPFQLYLSASKPNAHNHTTQCRKSVCEMQSHICTSYIYIECRYFLWKMLDCWYKQPSHWHFKHMRVWVDWIHAQIHSGSNGRA